MKFFKHLFMLCLIGMISIGAKAADIPDNEIWYTSRDGLVIEPYERGAFGASIVTNTYANGKGVITFSDAVTTIGDYAFRSRSGLTSVTIPNSVTTIGVSAFRDCSGLTSVTIPNSVTSIGDYAFIYCSGLTNVPIPNSVTSIGRSAFCYCSSLTEIEIPNSVSSIGDYAFAHCSGLTSVVIPNSVILIGERLFQDCSNLTSPVYNNTIFFRLPKSYSGPFNIPNGITTVASEAFYGCSDLTKVVMPNSVTSIGNAAFERCSNLITIVFPNSVTSIGSSAFFKCSGLTSVEINIVDWSNKNVAATISDLSNKLFSYVYNGKKIEGNLMIPDGLTTIGDYALYKNKDITNLTIPNSVTSIEDYAFSNCSGLKSITVNWARPLSITDQVFSGIDYDNCILYVPKGTSMMYMAAPIWINFKNIKEIDTPDPTPTIRGDVNGDGVVDVADITAVASIILTGKAKEEDELLEEDVDE